MHGRKREQYKALQRDPAVVSKLAAKAQQWHTLVREVLAEDSPPQRQLALTEKMLLVNPDPLYLWNIRRRVLMSIQNEGENDNKPTMLSDELGFTQAALENNPKAYGAWLHRKWALSSSLLLSSSTDDTALLENELQLIQMFLQKDERNFHGWNYRRFIVSLLLGDHSDDTNDNTEAFDASQIVVTHKHVRAPVTTERRHEILQAEWDFTQQKIQENFSNYSAIHYRTRLFPWKLETTPDVENLLTEEWSMILNAVFTEPDDQTAWWYAQYLLQNGPRDQAFYPDLIQTQAIEPLRELLPEAPESKWVPLGLYLLLDAFPDRSTREERQQCLETLEIIDADRKQRYEYLLRKLREESIKDV
ncbi:geranylgeranyl transferase type-2 subunit alpha [Fistulifera solaris]|jgi:geranylgeranyl transferase type-2 subunit alpha|uniref:Geranylgeranyl transferase type-2 subunit alpha n=1 Tax=Fistulifera solaris TaxID=1519565 RepID=A0A1Z5KSB4_FISSO|nr:geranylgeranyl transferase type-2 subunit alpha [Fistulifera solaris]|eukprot:GAX28982.1 geranylgeranyl transferase type-2 subunit alpha [Fistulifera solaris]